MDTQVDHKPLNPNMLAFKAALTYSIYFLVLLFLFNWMGINQGDPNAPFAEKAIAFLASWAPFILAIIYVQTTYKKELGGFISFGKAFSAGFKVAAYTGLFLALLMILYYKVLDKEAFQKLIDSALKTAGDDENKRKGIEMMQPYMTFFIAFGAAVSYTFFGLVISLINAAIIKKEQPLFFTDEE
jgi:hypothetical protein